MQLGRMKGKAGKWDSSWVSVTELKRGNVPEPWEAPSLVGSSETGFRKPGESPATSQRQTEQERPAQMVQPPGWAPSLRHRSAAMDWGWVLRLGVQRPGLGRGLELAAGEAA